MGRVHTKDDFWKNYDLAKECGFRNINIDLMFGIPGQTMGIWTDTIESALALRPEHVSFYSLQLEEGTPFYSMYREGRLKQTEDELDREMYHKSVSALTDKGYLHYEISNAAREGYQCRHNLKYWSMEDYLGLGLGAHSYLNGTRSGNIKDLAEYIQAGEAPSGDPERPFTAWRHENTQEDDITEYLITGMRKIVGIDLKDFERRFRKPIEECFSTNWNRVENYIAEGYLKKSEKNMRLTIKGVDISNTILMEFV
jgi:oxygen-independent coproporphyrinogen-3 oxidase